MIPINETLKQRAALGISALLGLIVFLTLLYTMQQWHYDWVAAHQEITNGTNVTTRDETADMITAIPDEHIFGKTFSKSGAVPITNLQLRVTGIVKLDAEYDGSVSKAYISIEGQPSKIYQTGDSLPYGVKVYDITQDTVILDNAGHLEKLTLPREKLRFKPREEGE